MVKQNIINYLLEKNNIKENICSMIHIVAKENNGHWIDVDINKLKTLKNDGYTLLQLANCFNVSPSTIKRRLKDIKNV